MEKFTLKEVVEVPRMGLKALKLKHNATNLTHVHVERKNDSNRVFSLAFKTDAPNKTGVPHILEHTTLCGSEKYPVRDPFFKMLSRSLANFMNAMTGFDYTFYPFATTNKADFGNLQQVYMDSVFTPLLKEQDFQQEGWRLEPSDLQKPYDMDTNPLIFKGVVYNEMKGQNSIPAYQHYMNWFMSIYPSMEYSAGDPLHIPDLKYEDLVKYHKDHYHPSNCFTFSYGDFGAEEAVKPLNEYLDRASFKPLSPEQLKLREPIDLSKTVVRKDYGPIDPMFDINRQHKVSLTWFVGPADDITQMLVWRVLSLLLSDGHASPFYQSLIDSGIGPEFSVNTGFEETPATLMFTIGLQGIEESKVPEFKRAVFDTISKIAETGFPQDRVDALLHQAEISNREVDANYGMGLLSKLVARAFHPNDDAMKLIDNEKMLEDFKQLLKNQPDVFQQQVKKYLDESRPYFQYEMAPSETYEAELATKEKEKLAKVLNSMTDEDKDVAITKAKELEKAVKEPQNLDLLPTVHTSDISKKIRQFPVEESKIKNDVPLINRVTGTQGISYVRMLRDLSDIPKDLVPYLLLYTDAITNVGTKSHSMAELEDLIKLNTGNLSVNAAVRAWGNVELGYGASALDSNLPRMYELFNELFTSPNFENISKLRVILDSSAASITNSLSQSGHKYAYSRASASINHKAAAEDTLSGFSFVQLIQKLSAMNDDQLRENLIPKLQQIHELAWNLRGVGVTTSDSNITGTHQEELNKFITSVNASAAPEAPCASDLGSWRETPKLAQEWDLAPKRTMVSFPSFQVSHVGAALPGSNAKLDDKDHASLQVLANLLTHKYLHPEIREKGGAYGGGASYNSVGGTFSMFSYRDPTPNNTLEVMHNIGDFATKNKFSESDVEEGKIGIFQSVDSPISPRNEISRHLGMKMSTEERQRVRENLLSVTPNDLTDVAHRYLVPNTKEGGVCVIGPKLEGWNAEELKFE